MVLTYYYPHWTGLTVHAQWVAEGLVRRGHQVTVLTAQYKPSLARSDRHNGVDIVRLPTVGRLSRGMLMPGFPGAVRRLIREHDVVQMHTPLPEALLVAWLARRAGTGSLFTHHGDVVMPAGLFNQIVQHGMAAMMTQAMRWSDAITSYSRDYAENSAFLRPFLHKASFIQPPVEIPSPVPEQVMAMRRELGLEGVPVVGFAGRFVEEKGFDFLLQAIPRIVKEMPGTKFAFAGECNVVYERFFERCKPLIDQNREHLVFLGLVTDRQRLANFYSMCDVFALPSRTDCLAIVQVEAMLCGTPAVVSDIPGARVAVQATGMGKLVPACNPPALAQGLLEVLRSPEKYRKSPEAIRAVFDPDRTISQYEELMLRLVKREAGGR